MTVTAIRTGPFFLVPYMYPKGPSKTLYAIPGGDRITAREVELRAMSNGWDLEYTPYDIVDNR